jgi:hypothetical protein
VSSLPPGAVEIATIALTPSVPEEDKSAEEEIFQAEQQTFTDDVLPEILLKVLVCYLPS